MFLTLKRTLRRGLARSWLLSKLWYRRFGLRVEGRPVDEVWYFAFGANMHDSAFRERRRMRPIGWRPGRIRDYRLRFNLEGRPKGKAAPANIEPSAGDEVWGVLYRITRRDLIWLDSTEGVPGPRYRQIWLTAEDTTGQPVEAVTYIAQGKETDGNPSLRYITLLRDGARAHGLPEHWVRTLEQVRPNDTEPAILRLRLRGGAAVVDAGVDMPISDIRLQVGWAYPLIDQLLDAGARVNLVNRVAFW